jgi:UDP-hydrolysing UDP-N-acetyl-D-glucosamine 2-epimerase
MHLSARHGRSIDRIRGDGWAVDAVVPWKGAGADPSATARHTGLAIASFASAYTRLRSDVVLVVGDRVEAFAAAAAAHISGRVVAHVHGGDRAAGQVDDALRHAITKLAHVHLPATRASANRIARLGEDRWRIHRVGSPGIDGIDQSAATTATIRQLFPGLTPRQFALVVLHPVDSSGAVEYRRAQALLSAVRAADVQQIVVVYPNNDPGSRGIIRCWEKRAREITYLLRDAPRDVFLGLMRDCAVLVGNSSSGIIEAASFGTPVVDVGPRQRGRQRGGNVDSVSYGQATIRRAITKIWNDGNPVRSRAANVYGGGGAGRRIANVLGRIDLKRTAAPKLITY